MAEADRPPSRTAPAPRPEASAEDPPFEAALERLEALVERLEGGELDLEEALARFEEGVALSRRLAERLGAAERRVERLLREGTGVVTRPLDPSTASSPDPAGDGGDAERESEES